MNKMSSGRSLNSLCMSMQYYISMNHTNWLL